MKVKFRTLTPIFTGDRFTNQSHQLRETGLLGSLRFWGQAITRGLGYKAARDDGKRLIIVKNTISY
jgi:CRISPR-associated protein Cmr1